MEEVKLEIGMKTLKEIVSELKFCLEPMVPYRRDPLEFAEAAHTVKDERIRKILSLLPVELIENSTTE